MHDLNDKKYIARLFIHIKFSSFKNDKNVADNLVMVDICRNKENCFTSTWFNYKDPECSTQFKFTETTRNTTTVGH